MALFSSKCAGSLGGGARDVSRLRERVVPGTGTLVNRGAHAFVRSVRVAASDDEDVPVAAAASAPPGMGAAATAAASSTSTSTSSGGGAGQEAWQPSAARTARRIERLKVSLLAALSSLDRGLAANAREAAEVDELCSQLEGLGGPVALAAPSAGAATLAASAAPGGGDPLAGTWRLVYSSGFNSGSLGGRRPGPPAAGFPATLGQVYQRIDPATAKLDNIVELLLSPPPPLAALGGLGGLLGEGLGGLAGALPAGPLRDAVAPLAGALAGGARVPAPDAGRDSPAARLTLRHDYEVTPPAGVRICYEETYGELVGSDLFAALPRLEAPQLPEPLRPPKFLRSASFEVTYLDAGGALRITRGDRGELRVYLRDTDPSAAGTAAGGGGSRAAAMALDYDD